MFKLAEISCWIQAKIANPEFAKAASSLEIRRLATLKEASSNELAFFFSKHYEQDLRATRAQVVVTGHSFVKPLEEAQLPLWKSSIVLACDDPYRAMGVISAQFSKLQSSHDHQEPMIGASVHVQAVVHPTCKIGSNVEIGAGVVIEGDVTIGEGAVIYPHCYIGRGCKIGAGTVLFPRVTLYENTQIGNRVRIHAGVVIGGDGFGYAPIRDVTTQKIVGHQKIYHLGRVVIEDDVEIGCNSTIDRGTLGDTVIRKNAKIDNLVQVGHNCDVGEGAVLCGASGMAGSSSLGKFVVVLAQAGTGNQVHVGDYSILAPYTGVTKDVPSGEEWCGMPARPIKDTFKIYALQNKMVKSRSKNKAEGK